MVNQILPYLGRLPYVLHRLDMNTSGACRPALRFIAPGLVLPDSHYTAPALQVFVWFSYLLKAVLVNVT